MKKKSLLFVFYLIFHPGFAQVSNIIPTGSSVAGTFVAETENTSPFGNPAMLSYVQKNEVSLFYEDRFLLSELSTKGLQYVFSSPYFSTGVQFSHFGYEYYHDILLGVGFARNFSDKFALGVQFNYFSTFFSGLNTYRSAFFPQIGLNVRLTSRLNLGFNTFNPFQSSIKETVIIKRIPSVFSLGTEYFFAENFKWKFQIDKEIKSSYRIATGFDYKPVEFFVLKAGAYYNDYLVMCIGTGLNAGKFNIDLNAELHPLLGVSPIAVIKYKF